MERNQDLTVAYVTVKVNGGVNVLRKGFRSDWMIDQTTKINRWAYNLAVYLCRFYVDEPTKKNPFTTMLKLHKQTKTERISDEQEYQAKQILC